MFFVEYGDNKTETEVDFGDWDHVPRDKPIRAIGLILPVAESYHIPLTLRGYERYYCGRLGATPLGGIGQWLGYVLIGIKNGTCVEIKARYDGITTRHYPLEQLNIRPEAMRKGIVDGG